MAFAPRALGQFKKLMDSLGPELDKLTAPGPAQTPSASNSGDTNMAEPETPVSPTKQPLQRRCDELETPSTEAKSGDFPGTQAAPGTSGTQEHKNRLETGEIASTATNRIQDPPNVAALPTFNSSAFSFTKDHFSFNKNVPSNQAAPDNPGTQEHNNRFETGEMASTATNSIQDPSSFATSPTFNGTFSFANGNLSFNNELPSTHAPSDNPGMQEHDSRPETGEMAFIATNSIQDPLSFNGDPLSFNDDDNTDLFRFNNNEDAELYDALYRYNNDMGGDLVGDAPSISNNGIGDLVGGTPSFNIDGDVDLSGEINWDMYAGNMPTDLDLNDYNPFDEPSAGMTEPVDAQQYTVSLQERCNELEKRPTEAEFLGVQTALTTSQDQLSELKKQIAAAEAKNFTLHAELKTSQDRFRKQKLQPNKAENELAKVRSNLQKVQADLEATRSALKDTEAREQEALKEQSSTDCELLDAQSELTTQDAKIKELEGKLQENTDKEEQISKLEEQLQLHSEQKSALSSARYQLEKLQTRFKKLQEEHQNTEYANRKLLKSSQTTQDNLDARDSEVQELQYSLKQLKCRYNEQASTLHTTRRQLEDCQKDFKKLENELTDSKQANVKLKMTSKTTQDNLVARDSEVQELHSQNKTQKEQLAKAEKDLKASQQKATVDESHIKSQDEAMSKLNLEISTLKERCHKLDGDVDTGRKISSELREKFNAIGWKKSAAKAQNDQLRSQLESKDEDWRQVKEALERKEKELKSCKEDNYNLRKENADCESLSKKVGAEYKRLEIDHRRVCNSLKTLRIVHAKCSTEAPNRSEQSPDIPTNEHLDPSAEETKDLVPRNIDGEKQLDDGESIDDNASQAMDETPLDDQLRGFLQDLSQGNFGGGTVSEDAVSRNGDWPDHVPGENGGTAAPGSNGGDNRTSPASDGTASPGAMGGDGPSAPANGGTAASGPENGDNGKAPASGGDNLSPKSPFTPGIGRPVLQKFQAPSSFPSTSSIIAFLLILAIACISFYFVSDHYSRLAYDAVLTRADDVTRAMLLSERMGGGTGTIWPHWLGVIMDDNVVEYIPGELRGSRFL
ncbi:MAG: hypothetical protein Q9195_002066 [Heterodermia aff. obscurata]